MQGLKPHIGRSSVTSSFTGLADQTPYQLVFSLLSPLLLTIGSPEYPTNKATQIFSRRMQNQKACFPEVLSIAYTLGQVYAHLCLIIKSSGAILRIVPTVDSKQHPCRNMKDAVSEASPNGRKLLGNRTYPEPPRPGVNLMFSLLLQRAFCNNTDFAAAQL